MRKPRSKIYIKVTPEESKITYSGIDFVEFNKYLDNRIQNILLIQGNYLGNKCIKNFELLEGLDEIAKLEKEDIYSFGNFAFMDYSSASAVAQLSNQQVAEVLYIAHTAKPLHSPFFAPLQNRFVYLAHDDGSICQLYCKDLNDFFPIVYGKISTIIGLPKPDYCDNLNKRLIEIAMSGVLIDLDGIAKKDGHANTKVYTVGEHSNIDSMLNNIYLTKDAAVAITNLYCTDKEWIIP